ncbi:MAG: hypothetical protein GY894_04820 [Planctomycetes bacterium]|jgi:hypothetical protein|nr:hypothetical protein [Planctomycetota bacterium]MCP4838668.1 hypothetical protein [Planctomycetota bacterium]
MNRFGIIGGAALIVEGFGALALAQDHPLGDTPQKKMMKTMQTWGEHLDHLGR